MKDATDDNSEAKTFLEEARNLVGRNADLKKEHIKQFELWAGSLLEISDVQSSQYPTKDVRVAQTLVAMEESDHAEAENRCELAQHHDSSSFEATLCLSKIFERNGNKKKALQELLKIRSYLQGSEFQEKSPVRWQDELDRFWQLCKETNAVKVALLACKDLSDQPLMDPAEYIDKALVCMREANHLRDAFSVLSTIREMDEQSLLTAALHSTATLDDNFHQHLNLALKDDPNLLLKGYTDAILGSADQKTTPFLRHWYGISLFYQGKTKLALLEWEDTCTELENRTEEPEAAAMLTRTAEKLASAYISIAQSHESGKEVADKHVVNLEKWKRWIDDHCPYTVNYLALLLGRLYRVTNQIQRARQMVRAHLATGFKLLEDGRVDNDRTGYFMIAEALLCLDDGCNARTAWSLISCVTPDDEKEDEEEEENEEREGEEEGEDGVPGEANVLSITCAGGCGWEWDGSTDLKRDLYHCLDCAHVRFEYSCYKKLRNGSLKERVCWKDHTFTKIPKLLSSDRKRIISGYVMTGKGEKASPSGRKGTASSYATAGKVQKIEHWLAALRHQYGIPTIKQHWTKTPAESIQMAKWRVQRSFDDRFSGRAATSPNDK